MARLHIDGGALGPMDGNTRAVPITKKQLGINAITDDFDSVIVNDLHWWTNDADLLEAAAECGIDIKLKDVTFTEHRVNGKSKGMAVINCHTKDLAIKLNDWFHSNYFQGKRINSKLASWAAGNPLNPANQDFPAHRPLSTAIHSNVFQPTNSHGGVNFNRVRPSARHHAGVGKGQPASWQYAKGSTQQSRPEVMPMASMLPHDPAIAWASQVDQYAAGFAQHGYQNAPEYMMGDVMHYA